MLKPSLPTLAGRCATPVGIVALSLLTSSCKLPSRATWAMVQQRGLIPVMMFPNPEPAPPTLPDTAIAQTPTGPAEAAPLKVQAVKQPEIARIPFAAPVPSRPGYVFSPHVNGKKLVDVRNYAAGAEVRCPYTMLAFNVPDFSIIAAAPPVSTPRPPRSIAEVASSTSGIQGNDMPMIAPDPTPDLSLPTEAEIPYGSRVAGRPGFVYSPFAAKNQLVDVAGIAPGVEVKCPYSTKLFRVPEPLPEEVAPAPNLVIPPAPPAPEAPIVSPPVIDSTPNAAPPATSPVAQTPTASWADKDKNLVQSPFGSAGQLVDVSGRTAGTTMQCPFTNKEFIIPAH